MKKIAIKTSEINNLAPIPASVSSLAKLVFDPKSCNREIVRIIELDQALTVNVLKWANSSWSGSQNKIASVQEALVRLGANNILKLVVGQGLAAPMKMRLPGYDLLENELWKHSVASALAVEELGRFVFRPVHGAAFTAAIIHDMGKLYLNRYIDNAVMREIREVIESERLSYIEAERRILGTDHAKIGGRIARQWKFPDFLVKVIERHHDPEPEPDNILDAVQIANAVAKLIGTGLGSEQMNLDISSEVPLRMGLMPDQLDSLCAIVKEKLEETIRQWEG